MKNLSLDTIKTGYDYLCEMCTIKTDFNAFGPRENPITKRVSYIINEFVKINIPYTLDMFDCNNILTTTVGKNKLVNVIVKFDSINSSTESILFLAHHDIKNIFSENAQDNSASVCNLLDLCRQLKNIRLNKNIIIAFTDGEEVGGIGARRLAMLINKGNFRNVLHTINLELTGLGTELWVGAGSYTQLSKDKIQKWVNLGATIKQIPFSDTAILESEGIKSVCIGLLPKNEIDLNFPPTWSLCHSTNDTFDKTNKVDMSLLVKLLLHVTDSE